MPEYTTLGRLNWKMIFCMDNKQVQKVFPERLNS